MLGQHELGKCVRQCCCTMLVQADRPAGMFSQARGGCGCLLAWEDVVLHLRLYTVTPLHGHHGWMFLRSWRATWDRATRATF